MRSRKDPKALTRWLMHADSAKQLLRDHELYVAHFNEIHFSAAWSRLGHLAESCATERGWLAANPSATSALQRDTLKRLGRSEKRAPRALSAIAHGAARA